MTPEDDRAPGWTADAPGALEAELRDSRLEIAELRRELDETNRGIIALCVGLEDAREAEARLAAIVSSSDDAMFSMTPELTITAWNPGAERLLGYSAAEITGQPAAVLVPAGLRDEFAALTDRVRAGGRPVLHDTRRRRKDGSLVEVAVMLSAMRDPDGELLGLSVVERDVTARLRADAELAATRARQEVLADRDRIARDLHDRVIRRVFGAGLALQSAAGLGGRPGVTARIEAAIRELDVAIEEIRSAIFMLQHSPRGTRSLRVRLLDQVAAAEMLGFSLAVSFVGPVEAVPETVAAELLAVAREALSNIARHARASAAELTLSAGDELVLRVSANGVGLGEITRRSGLQNMRERAEALGGSFSASSQDVGTCLEWRVPLPG